MPGASGALWIAKTGLDAQQTNVEVASNNIANAGTNTFKKMRAVFDDLVYQKIRQPGGESSTNTQLPSGLMLGTGVRVGATQRDFRQGSDIQTDRQFDMLIHGEGFFQIQRPDGSLAYTRNGNFQKDSTSGSLVTLEGLPLQPAITIPTNALNVNVSSDGIVSVTTPGTTAPTQVGNIQLASFLNSAGLEPLGDHLFIETNGSGAPQLNTPGVNGVGTLKQGALEASNVNIVEELINLIQAQRGYEMNARSVETVDGMLQFATQRI